MPVGQCDVAKVGIFWRVQSAGAKPALLVDCVPVIEAERYGDFQTHGGHYEFWCMLASLSVLQIRRQDLPDVAKWSEYEEWPRGRVVFHLPTKRFVLYADRKLQTPAMVDCIRQRFSLLPELTDIRSDNHYVSIR